MSGSEFAPSNSVIFDSNLADTRELASVSRQNSLTMHSGGAGDQDVDSPHTLAIVHEPALYLPGAASGRKVERQDVNIFNHAVESLALRACRSPKADAHLEGR